MLNAGCLLGLPGGLQGNAQAIPRLCLLKHQGLGALTLVFPEASGRGVDSSVKPRLKPLLTSVE